MHIYIAWSSSITFITGRSFSCIDAFVSICMYAFVHIYMYIYNAVTIFRWLFGFHAQPRAFFILYISVQTVSPGGACVTVVASVRGVVNYLLENHASGQTGRHCIECTKQYSQDVWGEG